MINYSFIKQDDKFKEIMIQGHSLYSFKNNDIVCSSVSTVIISTLNTIEIFKLQSKISFNLREGFFLLKILDFDETINNLLLNLEYTLKSLSEIYPKNLKKV
ncbi:MAG: ribosomal-processing cysteine protease Prp [Candidatus Phytoplasma stylosanthis]|nr:ribosomal-processing cysteine protease Prp [Candidatus Phytoplasma stylosanthis]